MQRSVTYEKESLSEMLRAQSRTSPGVNVNRRAQHKWSACDSTDLTHL